MFDKTPGQIAKIIRIPVKDWPGNCYCIAQKMVQHGVVEGKAVYGSFLGEISDNSPGFAGRQFTHHGWIIRSTDLVDPTRWVFEACKPYIFVGPLDHPDYDRGGNRLRMAHLKPPPPFDPKQRMVQLPLTLLPFVLSHFTPIVDQVCVSQVAWLCSLPLQMLGDQAEPVFKWAIDNNCEGFIPMDNRQAILGD